MSLLYLYFRNYGHKTIEEDLLTALFKANLITQESYDQAQTMQFQRAARTDKGVSAVRQIVSLKMRKRFVTTQFPCILLRIFFS